MGPRFVYLSLLAGANPLPPVVALMLLLQVLLMPSADCYFFCC